MGARIKGGVYLSPQRRGDAKNAEFFFDFALAQVAQGAQVASVQKTKHSP